MNRVEELTLKLVDGKLSPDEVAELAERITHDPAAQADFQALRNVEAGLRELGGRDDVSERVMARIRRLDVPGDTPRPPLAPTPGTWRRLAVAALLMVGFALSSLMFVARGRRRHAAEPAAVPAVAQLDHLEGRVWLQRHSVDRQAAVTGPLLEGDVLQVEEEGIAVLGFADGTRLTCHPNTRIRLPGPAAATSTTAPGIRLQRGEITAQVAHQEPGRSFVVATPQSELTVLGTIFAVNATETQTRLDVVEGRVGMTRKKDGARTLVPARHFAVAAPDAALEPSPAAPRITAWLVAYYRFDGGGLEETNAIRDLSGFGAPLDLWVEKGSNVMWRRAGGLDVLGPALIASRGPALKIIETCRRSGEITMEVWIVPRLVEQFGPARIVSLSRDTSWRDATLAMGGAAEEPRTGKGWFTARLRTTATGVNGLPELRSAPGSASLRLTHVVFTHDHNGRECVYLNGVRRSETTRPGKLTNWDDGLHLALGNEFTHDRSWLGTYYMVAIYSRALGAEDVITNFRAGIP